MDVHQEGWRRLKYHPPAILTHFIYLLSQGKMVISPHSSVYQFNQISILRTILAGREGDIGSGKSTFGT